MSICYLVINEILFWVITSILYTFIDKSTHSHTPNTHRHIHKHISTSATIIEYCVVKSFLFWLIHSMAYLSSLEIDAIDSITQWWSKIHIRFSVPNVLFLWFNGNQEKRYQAISVTCFLKNNYVSCSRLSLHFFLLHIAICSTLGLRFYTANLYFNIAYVS